MKRCDVQGGCWLKFTLSTTFAAATAAAARFDCFLFAGTGADDELLDDWKKLHFVIFDFLNYLEYKIKKRLKSAWKLLSLYWWEYWERENNYYHLRLDSTKQVNLLKT